MIRDSLSASTFDVLGEQQSLANDVHLEGLHYDTHLGVLDPLYDGQFIDLVTKLAAIKTLPLAIGAAGVAHNRSKADPGSAGIRTQAQRNLSAMQNAGLAFLSTEAVFTVFASIANLDKQFTDFRRVVVAQHLAAVRTDAPSFHNVLLVYPAEALRGTSHRPGILD